MWNYLNEVYEDVVEWWTGTPTPPAGPTGTPGTAGPVGAPPPATTVPAAGTTPAAAPVAACPADAVGSAFKKSLYVDLGWAFSGGTPTGTWDLTVAGQSFHGTLAGQIRLDEELDSLCGDGQLVVNITNGPTLRADLTLDLPNVQELEGIKRRLTNLGYYAGTDNGYSERAAWAVRAFKRKQMNGYEHNRTENETDENTEPFLTALRDEYGEHPGDNPASSMTFAVVPGAVAECGMFGPRMTRRGSFENATFNDDQDPEGAGDAGRWGSAATTGTTTEIAGTYRLYLRAFDPHAGDPVMNNKVNLPQPVHMAQFVLFELGFWVVGGAYQASGTGATQTKKLFSPDGGFGRNTQWAVREFQCYSKFANTAREDVNDLDDRYLPRLFANSPHANAGAGRYPDNGRVSGALNDATRAALQYWADQRMRCPVIVFSSSDTRSTVANGSNMASLAYENLWKYDDHASQRPRMFAIDYGGYYAVPAAHGGNVTVGGFTMPRPITVGGYTNAIQGGPVTLPQHNHCWDSEFAEVRPDTMVNTADPGDGSTLTAAELSTFKVVRTAAHFECLGYFDTLNAYDDVTISFGPCHWTLARSGGGRTSSRNEPREMPAMLSYFRNSDAAAYEEFFGRFGLYPEGTWPLTMGAATGTYNTRIEIQVETGEVNLSGLNGGRTDGYEENKYCKTWHSYYRFQMACRTSEAMREAMWDFSRIRVRDIMDKTFTIGTANYRVGDYATSEKSAAMLLRWHIYRPAHLFRAANNHLNTVMNTIVAGTYANADARETAFINALETRANAVFPNPNTAGDHLTSIQGWTNIPQAATPAQPAAAAYYALSLADPVLNDTANSFDFAAP